MKKIILDRLTITGTIEEAVYERDENRVGWVKISLGDESGCFIVGEQEHITGEVVVEVRSIGDGSLYEIAAHGKGKTVTFLCHWYQNRKGVTRTIVDDWKVHPQQGVTAQGGAK